jgi:hypothetical protein
LLTNEQSLKDVLGQVLFLIKIIYMWFLEKSEWQDYFSSAVDKQSIAKTNNYQSITITRGGLTIILE